MTDEEKKAIEVLKDLRKSFKASKKYITSYTLVSGKEYAGEEIVNILKTLLNLIEKQQKEIEQYKLLNANIEKANTIINDYISKDKIREFIKENKRVYEMKTPNKNRVIYKNCVLIDTLPKELLEEE